MASPSTSKAIPPKAPAVRSAQPRPSSGGNGSNQGMSFEELEARYRKQREDSYTAPLREQSDNKPKGRSTEYIIWGIVLILYDWSDFFFNFLGISEAVEFFFNIALEGALRFRGIQRPTQKSKIVDVLTTLSELIPFVDFLPTYTIEGIMLIHIGLKGGNPKDQSNTSKSSTEKKTIAQKLKLSITKPKGKIWIVAILLLLLAGIIAFGTEQRTKNTVDSISDFFNGGYLLTAEGANQFIQGAFTKVANAFQRRVDIATGDRDVYISKVDSSKELGVQVEWSKNTPKEFFFNEQIALIGTIKGKQLDNAACQAIGESCDEEKKIQVVCATNKNEVGLLQAGPQSSPAPGVSIAFSDIAFNSATLRCDFGNAKDSASGIYAPVPTTRTAYLHTQYQFATGADYEVPAVWAEQYPVLLAEKFRFNLNKIGRTPGPVSIGFVQYEEPLLISEEGSPANSKHFGFNIENVGNGKILKVDDVVIYLPEGASYLTCGGIVVCQEQKCKFPKEALTRMINIGPGEDVPISCSVYLPPAVLDARNPEYTPAIFNVLVKTTYQSSDEINFFIKDDSYIEEIECNEICEEKECLCKAECSAGIGYVLKGQSCTEVPKNES